GGTSCESIVEDRLARIRSEAGLNAFLAVYEADALARARDIDRRVAAGTAGPLAGMVVAVKDVICVAGKAVTCGSRILEKFEAPYDATVIERLSKADAIVIGKTNM